MERQNVLDQFEDPKHGIITISDDDIEVRHPKSIAAIEWANIDHVLAYKRDLLTTDLICLQLCNADETKDVELNEEMQGFSVLRHELEHRFPEFEEGYEKWLSHSPPFDGKPRIIWSRARE